MRLLFRKIKKALRKKQNVLDKKDECSKFVSIPKSTYMLNHNCFEFHGGKEQREYVSIGEKCLIGGRFVFETETGYVKIGNNVHIGNATFICRSSIAVGDNVTMAWDIVIYDHNSHSIYWEERKNDNSQCYDDFVNYNGKSIENKDWTNVRTSPIIIKDKVWIGFGVTILKGVTIGEGAVVGAKSVVASDVPAWSVVAGNPAKVVKMINSDK